MKKIVSMLLCFASMGYVSAQTPECKQAYESAKAFDDSYNNAQGKLVLNPNDKSVDKVEMAENLLKAYTGYKAVLPLDQQPNEKGQIKPKYTKKINESLKKHAINGDFINGGIDLWNAQKLYPDAYNSFIIGAELILNPEIVGEKGKIFADSIVGLWYYNAGNCAFNSRNYDKAAEAYKQSLDLGNTQSDVYKYLIAAYQNMQQNNIEDTVYVNTVQTKIYDAAEHAYKNFGSSDTYMFNNYMNKFFLTEDYKAGMEILNTEISKNPNNGNLYNLRAMFHRELKDNDARYADLIKAGELCNDYATLTDVAAELSRAGQRALNEIQGDDAKSKEMRLAIKDSYFLKALEVATRAKESAKDGNTSKIDGVIENINYGLETFF